MLATEMLITADGDVLSLDQAGADPIGAFIFFTPYRSEPQPGTLKLHSLGFVEHTVDCYAAGIGEKHNVAITADLLVQVAHLPMRASDDVFQGRAVVLQAWMLKHVGCAAAGRVELMLIQAAAPGSGDGQVSIGAVAGDSALHGL